MKLAIVHLALAATVAVCGCNQSPSASDKPASQPAAAAGGTTPAADGDGATRPAAAAKVRRVFVANYGDDTLSVVEGDPVEMEVRTLTGFDSPQSFSIRSAPPRYLAVANGTAFGVTLIDPDTLEQKAYIELDEAADELRFSADGKQLYLLHTAAGRVSFLDVDTLKVTGDPIQFLPRQPRFLVVEPGGGRVFVTLVTPEGAEVAHFNPATREVATERITVDIVAKGFALGNNGRSLVTASFNNSTLSVIDVGTLKVVATQPSPTGIGLAIHPSKPIAYTMASFDDEFHVINIETGENIKTISAGRFPTHPTLSPDGRFLYVPHENSDSVIKLDTETNEVVAKIAVGKEPVAVAVYEP